MRQNMDRALENAIYYMDGNTDIHEKYTIISKSSYDGTKDSFKDVICSFKSDIGIKNMFKNLDNICYDICDGICQYYDKLLIEKIDMLLIVTRQDSAISIVKNSNNSDTNDKNDTNDKDQIGIIKIDAVLAELLSAGQRNEKRSRFPLLVIGAIIFIGVYIYTNMDFELPYIDSD